MWWVENAIETYLLLHFVFQSPNQQPLTPLLVDQMRPVSDWQGRQGPITTFVVSSPNDYYVVTVGSFVPRVGRRLQGLIGEHQTAFKRSIACSIVLY